MMDYENSTSKVHFGSHFIVLGTICLFLGSGASLGIANNYVFFLIGIIVNVGEALLHKKKAIHLNVINSFLLIVSLLTIFYVVYGKYDRGSALSMLMYAALLLSIDFNDYNKSDAVLISKGVVISAVVFSLLILFQGHEYLYRGTAKYTYTQTFGSQITFEPNYLGTIISMGFCLNIVLIGASSKEIKSKILYILSAVISLIGVMLTGSRSALVSIIIFGITIVLTMKRGKTRNRIIVAIILFIVIMAVLIALNVIPETVYLRMLGSSYVDRSNMKRIADWTYGLQSLIRSPLFGYGPQPTLSIIMSQFNFHGDVHNTFLTFGVMFGVVPFILFIILILNIVGKLYKKNNRLLFASLIAMVFEWNILACQFTLSTWLMLIICLTYTTETSIENREIGLENYSV